MENISPDPAPERTLLTARRDYVDAFDALLALAQRELRIFDPDLLQLDPNSPARVATLGAFLRRSRDARLYVALHDSGHFTRHCPRLAELFTLFSANVFIQDTDGDGARAQDCFVIADDHHFVRRPVAAHPRGVVVRNDPHETAVMRERFDQIWESSRPATPPTTAGL